jgi:hypothetical protein
MYYSILCYYSILLYEFNKTLYYHMSVFNGTNVIIRLIKRVSY